eukprot:3791224-Amphidinium_carterae.1
MAHERVQCDHNAQYPEPTPQFPTILRAQWFEHNVAEDNGVERDHKRAMALHKWTGPEPTLLNGQTVTMR